MSITAKVIEDSIGPKNPRITTLELRYPRFIHCFHEDTEFLSQIGDEFPEWRTFDAVHELGAKVAQYDSGMLSFVMPLHSIKRKSDGVLIEHKRKTFEFAVTPEHRMYSLRRTTNNEFLPHVDLAKDWLGDFTAHRRILQAGLLCDKVRSDLSATEAELIAFYVADGHKPENGEKVQFHFRKERKVSRVKEILTALHIEYEESVYGDDTVIRFFPPSWVDDCYTDCGDKKYPECVWNMPESSFEAFKLGTLLSDGNLENREINTTSAMAAEQLQILAALNNTGMNIRMYGDNIYKQKYLSTNYVGFRADKNKSEEVEYQGNVVCFTVPSGFLLVRYKKFVMVSGNCEYMTHRQFSRNASSSRAIPVERQIRAIKEDTAMPIHWGKNQKGMQAFEENDSLIYGDFCELDMIDNTFDGLTAEQAWNKARDRAIEIAEGFVRAGYHKQVVNRILEPFSHITVVMTATTLDNFFGLRRHPDAQPEIKALADAMFEAVEGSTPTFLNPGEWHLPYVLESERDYVQSHENLVHDPIPTTVDDLIKVSVSRCARVSYKTHDGKAPSFDADLALYDRLVGSAPLHASPAEHQATPDEQVWSEQGIAIWENPWLHGNFEGWQQYRKTLDGECIKDYTG